MSRKADLDGAGSAELIQELIGGIYPEKARLLGQRTGELHRALASETDARLIACDATDRRQVDALFHVVGAMGAPVLVVYNASYRNRGPFVALDAGEVARTLEVTALGGFDHRGPYRSRRPLERAARRRHHSPGASRPRRPLDARRRYPAAWLRDVRTVPGAGRRK